MQKFAQIYALAAICFLAGGIMPLKADVKSGIKTLEAGDVKGAVKEFQNAYDGGDADGAFYIGRLFEMGLGTDKNITKAAQLYAAASKKGSALAQNRLGLMYLDGEFVLQDYQRAFELICQSAEAGDANGMFNCGLIYSEGKGVPKNPEKAVEYWKKAADKNNVAAINYLGSAYKSGNGVEKNPAKVFEQFNRTAAAGNPLGMFEIARSYQLGIGTEQDMIKAYAFANLAAVRGYAPAKVLRDQLMKKMNQVDVEKAQKFARDWKAVPIDQAG